jgi:hypothetical protein
MNRNQKAFISDIINQSSDEETSDLENGLQTEMSNAEDEPLAQRLEARTGAVFRDLETNKLISLNNVNLALNEKAEFGKRLTISVAGGVNRSVKLLHLGGIYF